MKRRDIRSLVVTGLAMAMMATTVSGCQNAKPEEVKYLQRDINLDEFIKVGEYKGVAVDKVVPKVYTEDDLNAEIQSLFEYQQKYTIEPITDRDTVKEGDTASISFVGFMDGEEFAGGTGDADLTIGSHTFIEGFEDGLIGAKVNDTVTLDLHFPDPYQNSPDLSGKPVQFQVTVKSIGTKKYDEFDDAFAQSMGYTDAATAKTTIINGRNSQEIQEAEKSEQKAVMAKIKEASEILGYPQDVWQEFYDVMIDYYKQQASNANVSYEDFLAQNNLTEDTVKEQATSFANSQTDNYLILMAVVQNEKIVLPEEEFSSYVSSECALYSITEEEMFTSTPEIQVKENLLENKALDFIMDNLVYNE